MLLYYVRLSTGSEFWGIFNHICVVVFLVELGGSITTPQIVRASRPSIVVRLLRVYEAFSPNRSCGGRARIVTLQSFSRCCHFNDQ
jgi:hypothetical protein